MISLTERATKEVKSIIEDERQSGNLEGDDVYLRIGIKGGGCSGFSFLLDLSDGKDDTDEVFENNGVEIICDPKSLIYLTGTTVDFVDELMGRGFQFDVPGSTGQCGCGKSVSF